MTTSSYQSIRKKGNGRSGNLPPPDLRSSPRASLRTLCQIVAIRPVHIFCTHYANILPLLPAFMAHLPSLYNLFRWHDKIMRLTSLPKDDFDATVYSGIKGKFF